MAMTPAQRAAVVAEAESWIGTPYHTNACVKGAGADCAMMPFAVYIAALGMTGYPPLPAYQWQWFMNGRQEKYLEYVRAFGGIEIPLGSVQPGDFALWRHGRVYAHGGIVTAWPKIIHAVAGAGVVRGDATRDDKLSRTAMTQPLFFTF